MHYIDNKSVLMRTKNITLAMLTLQQHMNLKPPRNRFTLHLSTPFILQLPSYKISVEEGETIRAKTRIEIGSHRTTDIPR